MRWLLVVSFLLLAFPACIQEGQNVWVEEDQRGGGQDRVGDPDGLPTEVGEEPDPGPPFGNTLAWKVLDPGVSVLWNTLIGVTNKDGTYHLFAGGGFGTIMRFDSAKKRWHSLSVTQTVEVNGLWADGLDYLVAVGEEGLLKRYFDFSSSGIPEWYNDDLATGLEVEFEAVSGYDRNNLWAVGAEGTIIRFDGESWTQIPAADAGLTGAPPPTLFAVLALGPEKALIAGDGLLLSYNAGEFTLNQEEFKGYKVRAILDAGDAVWLGADKGTVFKSDGQGGWEKHNPNVYSQFKALWRSPEGLLFAAGTQTTPTVWHYDGNAQDNWQYIAVESPKFIEDQYPELIVEPQSRLSGLWGTGAQNLYACTREKQILHYAVHP